MKINYGTILFRAIILLLVQVLVLKRISLPIGDVGFLHFLVYPLFIMLFPINFSRYLLLLIALVYGLTVDMFYHSLGVHAAALVVMAYARNIVLNILAPYEGYKPDAKPYVGNMGVLWFIPYAAILLLIHHFSYFSLESFSLVYLFEISINTMMSLMVSVILVVIYMFIFRPKE
jgi:rod shape-determining protein MreD